MDGHLPGAFGLGRRQRKSEARIMCDGNLRNLLDALTETSVYVIEAQTHRLLFFNQRCRETGRGAARLGAKCHEVWPEVCANCPLDALGDGPSSHIVCEDPLLKTTVDATANRIVWDGIPAIVVTATPHRLNLKEAQGFEKIERMYAQSLVTVFNECIIANLTADYYVNCQKDALWSDIPVKGQFGTENQKYAQKTVHPDDLQAFNEHFSRAAMLRLFGEGKAHITLRLRRLTDSGAYHMVEFTAARISGMDDGECWCALIFRDIHEEYLQEQLRGVEMSQLAAAVRAAYQMVISVNLSQNTYYMMEYDRFPTKKAARLGRFDELIEVGASTVDPEYRAEFVRKFSREALLAAFARGERKVSMEMRQMGDDGVYHWNFTQVVRVESPHTDDVMEITLSKNVDEERRQQEENLKKEREAKKLLQEALQKAEAANRAKSDFLSRMSHDIRTPMNAIVGMTELAQIHQRDEVKLRDYLAKIKKSSAHLLGLINEVLDVSKIESGAAELDDAPFDLADLARDAASLVQLSIQDKAQLLTIEIAPGLHAQVKGDEQRLRQVLVNILDNASKYTPERGKILLSLAEINRESGPAGAYRFVVRDNGIGMKKAFLQHIFEPFSRADDARISRITGTGLGMTVVKNILDMMGGTIEVESESGKGTQFTITLCLDKVGEMAPAAEAPAEPAQESFADLRVLLVEDNEINQQIACDMLGFLGAQVEVVGDGRQAVNAVLSHPPLYYDLVFMDIQMPVMDGYAAARSIRGSGLERIDELPILAMTADAFAEDARQARLAGMDGHFPKPISIDQLRIALSRCAQWKRQHGRGESFDATEGRP